MGWGMDRSAARAHQMSTPTPSGHGVALFLRFYEPDSVGGGAWRFWEMVVVVVVMGAMMSEER